MRFIAASLALFFSFYFSAIDSAAARNSFDSSLTKKLIEQFKNLPQAQGPDQLEKKILRAGPDSVPALIRVMKSGDFPDKARWVATFLLGQVMGSKAAPFLSRFTEHPNWVLRLASTKALLNLEQDQFHQEYRRLLKDESLLVRTQALENIRKLNIKDLAPHVWAMLYDKRNYSSGKLGRKRTHLIKNAIRTVADLGFKKAKAPLLKMVQKKKYDDIFSDIDYGLTQIVGKKSPQGPKTVKRHFWQRMAVAEMTF